LRGRWPRGAYTRWVMRWSGLGARLVRVCSERAVLTASLLGARLAGNTATKRRARAAARVWTGAPLRSPRAVCAAVRRVRQHRCASGLSPRSRVCLRALSTAMAFAALQEGVFKCVQVQVLRSKARAAAVWSSHKCCFAHRIDGFRYGGWMTFVTSAWFCVCSGLELLVSGETQRRGTWRVSV
jgi:hypothetical protein